MKILLTNCWQAGNTGDVAIWVNLMKHLKDAFPDAEFLISSQSILEWDCKQLESFQPKFYENDLITAVQDADVVISQGGGYMIGDNMFQYLQAFDLAQSMGKPTFFNTQTMVGPISEDTKTLLRKVIDNAIVVSPREEGTYNFLKNVGVQRNLVILPDTVFDIGIKEWEFPFPNSVRFAIRGYDVDADFVKKMALVADMVSESMGKAVFLPVGHGGNRNDIVIAKEILSNMKHEGFLIDRELTAEELKYALSDGILLSDRYHGIVYAVSMNTPFVAMTPDIDSKMQGLLNIFNYPIPVLDKHKSTAEEIFGHMYEVWKNRIKFHGIFETVTPGIKEKAASIYPQIIQGIKDAINK